MNQDATEETSGEDAAAELSIEGLEERILAAQTLHQELSERLKATAQD